MHKTLPEGTENFYLASFCCVLQIVPGPVGLIFDRRGGTLESSPNFHCGAQKATWRHFFPMWVREGIQSPGSGNPSLWGCLWHWRFKHKDMDRKISQSFKGESCCLKFANVSVESSEGAKLELLANYTKGTWEAAAWQASEVLIYVDLCSDFLWPQGKLLCVWTSMPSHPSVRSSKWQCRGKWLEKRRQSWRKEITHSQVKMYFSLSLSEHSTHTVSHTLP